MQLAPSPPARLDRLARVPAPCFFLVSAVFHYLGPSFAVLLFAHVDVVDGSGRRVPTADNLLAVETSGAAERVAFGTAHPQNLDSFADAEHRAYEGRALLVFRAGAKKGGLRVKVSSAGLKSATLSSLRVG